MSIRERGDLRIARNPLKRALFLVTGTLSLLLGTLGIFIRGILPTTPFLLLAAYCYGRSSKRMYQWIYGHRVFGPILIDWETHRSLSRRTKTVAIASVWIGILLSITVLHFTVNPAREPYLQALLLIIATSVTIYLATRLTATHQAVATGPILRTTQGIPLRTKTLVIALLWTGMALAALILEIRTAQPPAPHHWLIPLTIALTVTAGVATKERPRPPHEA